MKPEKLNWFRRQLEIFYEALNNDGHIRLTPNCKTAHDKADEDHQPLNEMLQSIASSRNKNRSVIMQHVTDALETIKKYPEEYGLCTECEAPIPEKRLEMMPYCQNCVHCQAELEGQAGAGRRRHLTDFG